MQAVCVRCWPPIPSRPSWSADGHETECARLFGIQAASVVRTRRIVLRYREQVVLRLTELRQVTFLSGGVPNRENCSVRPVSHGRLRGQTVQEGRQRLVFVKNQTGASFSWAGGSCLGE